MIHARRFGPGTLRQSEGFARFDSPQLLFVAHEDEAIKLEQIGKPDQAALVSGRDH